MTVFSFKLSVKILFLIFWVNERVEATAVISVFVPQIQLYHIGAKFEMLGRHDNLMI